MKIGLNYETQKKEIEQKIKEGNIITLDINPDRDYCCYFCNEKIDNRVRVLIDKSKVNSIEMINKYYSCNNCYKERLPKDSIQWIVEIPQN